MPSFASRIPLRFALVAIAMLAACDSGNSPTAPLATRGEPSTASLASTGGAERVVEESLYDLSDSFTEIDCQNGQVSELVDLEGQLFERFTLLYNPSGAIHLTYHTMPVGLQGVGTVSGEEYRVKEQDQGAYTQTLMGAGGTYRQTVRLVGRTSHRSFSIVVKGHYTMNANGEIAVEREKATFACDA
jgi:hypothetical protein